MEINTRVITTMPQVIFEYDEDKDYEVVYEVETQQILFLQECDLTREQINKLIITVQLPEGQEELNIEENPSVVIETEDFYTISTIAITKKENLNLDGVLLEKRGIYLSKDPSSPIAILKVVLNETSNMPFVAQVQEMIELIKSASIGPEWDHLPDQAESPQILQGYSAYNERKKTIVGTMINNGNVSARLVADSPAYTIPAGYHSGEGKVSIETEERTIFPSLSEQTIISPSAGKLLSKVTVQPAENLVSLQSKTVTPSASFQTITPDSGYGGLSQVIVNGNSNLTGSNIKTGVSIFGVDGTLVEGIQVQKKSGTNWTNSNGQLTLSNLGFIPDLVLLYMGSKQQNGIWFDRIIALVVNKSDKQNESYPSINSILGSAGLISAIVSSSSTNNTTVSIIIQTDDSTVQSYSNQSVPWKAIKYTA